MAKTYPWATHIGKMDTDTFPYLHRLTMSLHDHSNASFCPNHYVGLPQTHWNCGKKATCPPWGCDFPESEDFFYYRGPRANKTECWSYAQGGLYVISAGLVHNATAPGEVWESSQEGYEDMVTGRALNAYGRRHGLCISIWNPYAWDHFGSAQYKSLGDDELLLSPSALDKPVDYDQQMKSKRRLAQRARRSAKQRGLFRKRADALELMASRHRSIGISPGLAESDGMNA